MSRSSAGWRALIAILALPEAPLLDLAQADVPPQASRVIGSFLDSARLLGCRTAELHLALASDLHDPAFTPEAYTTTFQAYLHRTMRELTGRIMSQLRSRLDSLMEADRAQAEAVLALEGQIFERIDRLLDHPVRAAIIRIHGDYHLGQVLYTGSDFMIIDFEGEPARALLERRMKRSALQDVAGMLRSFHYAAYAAYFAHSQNGRLEPGLEPWARFWHLWVSAAYLKAYLEVAGDAPFIPRDPADLRLLLDAYVVEKAVYELGYELNNRPSWARIPLQGIVQVAATG